MASLVAVFSQQLDQRRACSVFLPPESLHDRDPQSLLDVSLRPGAPPSRIEEDDLDAAANRCLVDIDTFPCFFVSPEIMCHHHAITFSKGPNICLILETPFLVRNFISQLFCTLVKKGLFSWAHFGRPGQEEAKEGGGEGGDLDRRRLRGEDKKHQKRVRVANPSERKKCPIFSEKMPHMGFLLHKVF